MLMSPNSLTFHHSSSFLNNPHIPLSYEQSYLKCGSWIKKIEEPEFKLNLSFLFYHRQRSSRRRIKMKNRDIEYKRQDNICDNELNAVAHLPRNIPCRSFACPPYGWWMDSRHRLKCLPLHHSTMCWRPSQEYLSLSHTQ